MVARVTLVALVAACLLAAACSSAGAEASDSRRMLVKTSALGAQAEYFHPGKVPTTCVLEPCTGAAHPA